jgi:Na+-driven multidrug efflux pump
MKNIEELSSANVGRLMLKYFIPAFIGVFVNALYNIVDRIFIGQGVGAEALSGISVVFPVMLIMMVFLFPSIWGKRILTQLKKPWVQVLPLCWLFLQLL